jgi:hypothetical protein
MNYSGKKSGRGREDKEGRNETVPQARRGADDAVDKASGPISRRNQIQPVGLGKPAILHACLAGP